MSLTELSRSGEPTCPRKYFWATMLVAFCDQLFGNSTSLLEGDAIAVADVRVAQLPLDGVERMHSGGREEAIDR